MAYVENIQDTGVSGTVKPGGLFLNYQHNSGTCALRIRMYNAAKKLVNHIPFRYVLVSNLQCFEGLVSRVLCPASRTTVLFIINSAPDPCHFGVDPDPDADPAPAIFVIDLEDPNKKQI